MNLTLSVVIPVYNAEETLRICLESVLSCQGEWIEVIVVDDCSTDRSAEIAKEFPIKYLRTSINLGPGAARNRGAQVTTGDLVLFVDSDVIIKKNDIIEIKNYFKLEKDCQTVSFNFCPEYNVTKNFFTDYKNLYMNFILSKFKMNLNFVYGACCATRKKGMILWPEDVRYTEDSLWGYIQHSQGFKINLIQSIKLIHLKKYNFTKLLINDFKISTYFSLSFFRYNRWDTIYSKKNFGHTAKNQKISLIVLGFFLIFLLVDKKNCGPLLFVWLAFNFNFFYYLSLKRRISFVLLSVGWTFVDHLIYICGIIYGAFIYLNERRLNYNKVRV